MTRSSPCPHCGRPAIAPAKRSHPTWMTFREALSDLQMPAHMHRTLRNRILDPAKPWKKRLCITPQTEALPGIPFRKPPASGATTWLISRKRWTHWRSELREELGY